MVNKDVDNAVPTPTQDEVVIPPLPNSIIRKTLGNAICGRLYDCNMNDFAPNHELLNTLNGEWNNFNNHFQLLLEKYSDYSWVKNGTKVTLSKRKGEDLPQIDINYVIPPDINGSIPPKLLKLFVDEL